MYRSFLLLSLVIATALGGCASTPVAFAADTLVPGNPGITGPELAAAVGGRPLTNTKVLFGLRREAEGVIFVFSQHIFRCVSSLGSVFRARERVPSARV